MSFRAILVSVSVCAVSATRAAGAGDLPESVPPPHTLSTIGVQSGATVYGTSEAITPLDAAASAVEELARIGVTDILVCEIHRIEAPLTAYLVDALGSMDVRELVNGVPGRDLHFDTFRIVLRDGAEYDGEINPAGERIAFIARGLDPAGEVVWLPGCGPDFEPAGDEPSFADSRLQFEFLLWREDFESLATRYPREVPEDPAEELRSCPAADDEL